jgi:hypothetical protein
MTGETREDETSDPPRFSRKSREFRANNEIRFTRNALSDGAVAYTSGVMVSIDRT